MVYRYPSSGVPQQTSAGYASRPALIAVKTRDRDERGLLLQTDYDRPFASAETGE
jgi:hypothetical protein